MAGEVDGEAVGAALEDIATRLRSLREATGRAGSWSAVARGRVLARLDAVSAAVGLVRGPVVLAERDEGTSQRVGDRSFEAAVGRSSGKGFLEARREVRQAETLAAMPSVADAVGSGGMTLAHVDAVAKVVAGASGGAGAGVLSSPAGQAAVVDLARGRDAGEFARDLARYVASSDPGAHERDHATQRAQRFLVLSDQADGTFLKGRLDRFAGERLRLALEATGCAPDADRSREEAMADALVAVADTALSGAGGGPGGALSGAQRRPHVSLLLREETFAALLADQRERVTRTGLPMRETDTQPAPGDGGEDRIGARQTPAPAALSESGLAVSRSEVARILCDASVARIVVDAADVPLNLGSSQRLYSGAQRRAVIARDKQCAWPGCGIPARWGEVHHIRWWARDRGETSVHNGVLLCEHHHHLVHQHDLVIERHTPARLGPRRGTQAGPRQRTRASDAGATDAAVGEPVAIRLAGEPCVRYSFRTRTGRLVAPAAESSVLGPTRAPDGAGSPELGPTTSRATANRPAGAGVGRGLERPSPGRPKPTGPETRAGASPPRPATAERRLLQPSFLDELIAAQPPDPPF